MLGCKKVNELSVGATLTMSTAVQFHSQRYVPVPGFRMQSYIPCPEWFYKAMQNHVVSVTIATKHL